jgi:hypothetical protein
MLLTTRTDTLPHATAGFRRSVIEIFVLLGCYVGKIASYLPTFRDKLSVPSSRDKKSKMGPIGCPETWVNTILFRVNIPGERKSHYQTPLSSYECQQNATLRVTTAVLLKIPVFYDVTACRWMNGFGGNKQFNNTFKKGSMFFETSVTTRQGVTP